MWQEIPGGWDLVRYRTIQVADGFRQTGMGMSAVDTDQRSFTGAQLATDFVVQTGHISIRQGRGQMVNGSDSQEYTCPHGALATLARPTSPVFFSPCWPPLGDR